MDKDRGKLCTSFTAYSLPYTGDQGVNAPSFFFFTYLRFFFENYGDEGGSHK